MDDLSGQRLLDVVFHSVSLRFLQGVESPLGWGGPRKKVNGAVIGTVGWQRHGPHLAEHLGEIVVVQRDSLQVGCHEVSGRHVPADWPTSGR